MDGGPGYLIEAGAVVASEGAGTAAGTGAPVATGAVVAAGATGFTGTAAGCGMTGSDGAAFPTEGIADGSTGNVFAFAGGFGSEVIGCTELSCVGVLCWGVLCGAVAGTLLASGTLLLPGGFGRDVMGCAVCACRDAGDAVHKTAHSMARLVNIASRHRCMVSLVRGRAKESHARAGGPGKLKCK